ncbi:MAG: class I SAM-dependent methyltransferase [Planctomycetota bacterium]|jgi:SAM-dependent methyltransferase
MRSVAGTMTSESPQLDYDELAREYAAHRTVHPNVLRRLIATGGIGAAKRVLEVGCGTGNYLGALASVAECRGWGVDPSAEMLSRARRRHPTLEFLQGEAAHLPFGVGLFDVVFSVDVIHHVRYREQAFREAHRVLRTGGRICTVTDSESIIRSRRPLAVFFPESVAADLARYPAAGELKTLMSRAGFEAYREEEAVFSYVTSNVGPYRDKAFSCLHLIPESAYRRGLAKLEDEVRAGGVQCESRYVLLWGTKDAE